MKNDTDNKGFLTLIECEFLSERGCSDLLDKSKRRLYFTLALSEQNRNYLQ